MKRKLPFSRLRLRRRWPTRGTSSARASRVPSGPPQPPFTGQAIFCCVPHALLVISLWGTCFVGNARRIVPTWSPPRGASAAAPRYSCRCCLFNSTDKRVPQNHIKVLGSCRSLLPTATEPGTNAPCLLATHRDNRSACKIPARSFEMKSNILSGI